MGQDHIGVPLARSPSRRRLLGLLLGTATAPLLAGCVDPTGALPQPVPTTGFGEPLSSPQLEQLLAPVALYPDALLAQVLMASTYPLEVVQAQRWLERPGHGSLSGAALEQALQAESWDVSVKSLVPFPDVLKRLNDNLEWTQQLGDAVLAQQQEVLTAIQTLRQRAQSSGSLRSGAEQTVSGSSGAIVIEPAQPQIVYVPAYDPTVVYGAWPYPAYPPYYWPYGYGGAVLAAGIGFAAGVAIAGSYWGWARPGWGSGDINIDVDRTRNFDRSTFQNNGNRWQHDSRHRQGVAYRDGAVRDRYQGGSRGQGAAAREQFRGRTQQLPVRSPGGGGQGFDGLGRGGDVRAASDRGRQSFGGQRGGGYGGGGYRGGGGYGGGGFGGGGGYRGGGGFGGGGGGFRGGGGRGGRR